MSGTYTNDNCDPVEQPQKQFLDRYSDTIEDFQFLKLGGSLITKKTKPKTAHPDLLARLAEEIAAAKAQKPSLKLVIGHGSGSFGHVPAKKYATRQGVYTPQQWQGFIEVWRHANALNRLVIDTLAEAGVPGVACSPLAAITANNGNIHSWHTMPIQAALDHGLIPVIQGDTIFDTACGGTILSTENLFVYLAKIFRPKRILLAGIEPGVWADFPTCKEIIPVITTANLNEANPFLAGSSATDVTGGMVSKVHEMLSLVQDIPSLEVLIFSGKQPGNVQNSLCGESFGTVIRYN